MYQYFTNMRFSKRLLNVYFIPQLFSAKRHSLIFKTLIVGDSVVGDDATGGVGSDHPVYAESGQNPG